MKAADLRVCVDARTIRPWMTGVGHYTFSLVRALSEMKIPVRAVVMNGIPTQMTLAELAPSVEWIETGIDYESHPWGDFGLRYRFPKLLREGEIYHGTAFGIPAGAQSFRRVVSIHDLGVFAHPELYRFRFAAYLRWVIRRSAAAADRIIVPTQAVFQEIEKFLKGCESKTRIIPDAPVTGPMPKLKVNPATQNLSESFAPPYFVSLGSFEARKDPATGIRALKILTAGMSKDQPLTWYWLGGQADGRDRDRWISESATHGVENRFRSVGYVSREEIRRILAHASGMIFSSCFEGFGMPPLEAMAAGVPAIVSDIPVLREVCGDAALYFPPGDATALAGHMKNLLSDQGLAEKMREKGREHVAQFSWERTARETAKVYEELLS